MIRRFVLPWMVVVIVIVMLEVLGSSFVLFSHPRLGYDKMLHFLGGNACGIFGAAIALSRVLYRMSGICDRRCTAKTRNRRVLFFAMASALIIGDMWEAAQAYFPWLRDASDYDWYDTVGDIVFDTVGGIVAGIMYQEKR